MAPVNLTFDNQVMASYGFYSVISLGKMALLGFQTASRRGKKQAFCTPEDARFFGKKTSQGEIKTNFTDPDVERVRRNHLNDLENIPMHIIVGFFYVLTNPDPKTALWHFRIFCASRFVHTFCYQAGIQPWRALAHLAGLAVTASMGVRVIRRLV